MSANPSFLAMASNCSSSCFYLVDADLVNLIRRQVGSGALLYQKAVIGLAIGQSPYAGIVAAAGDVLRLEKFAEANISRYYLAGDRREYFFFNPCLLGR